MLLIADVISCFYLKKMNGAKPHSNQLTLKIVDRTTNTHTQDGASPHLE